MEKGSSTPRAKTEWPQWATALTSSMLTAVFLSAGGALWAIGSIPIRATLLALPKETLLLTIAALLLALLLTLPLLLHFRSLSRLPLSERFAFDESKGCHVDRRGYPLCPRCLNDGRFTRVHTIDGKLYACAEHGLLYDRASIEAARLPL